MSVRIKCFFFFLLSCFVFTDVKTQDILIQGEVKDQSTGEKLEFVTVYIANTKYFAETNQQGRFEMKIPFQNTVTLNFSKLGYEKSKKSIRFSIGINEYQVDHVLKALIQTDVVIKESSLNKGTEIREQAKSFELLPTVSGNIESVLPSIALGVRTSAGGELSSQYSVRGGSYDENLVFVNDFEIYRPQLIRNGQQEGLSFPNADLIRELSFSSGGFESKFGDKQASVLDIKYKVPDSLRASVVASFLGLSSHVEGSTRLFKNKLRYLIGARYKSNSYLLSSLDVKGEYQPQFFDLQSYVSYDLSPALQLAWISNWNKSKFSLIPEESSVAKGSAFLLIRLNTFFEGKEIDEFDQKMTGLSLTYFPKNKKNPYYFKLISSVNKGIEAEQFDILGYYRLTEIETGGKDDEGKAVKLWGEGTQHVFARNYLNSFIHQHEWRGGIDLSANEKLDQFIQGGIGVKVDKFDDKLNEWERIDSAGFSLPYDGKVLRLNNVYKGSVQVNNQKYFAWIQDEIQWIANSKWSMKFIPGIRANYTSLNDEAYINPRMKIEISPRKFNSSLLYWLSGGYYFQPPFYREMRRPDGSLNSNLRSQKSIHAVLGMKRDFMWRKVSETPFRWISEIYVKDLWDVVSYELENVRIRYAGENNANAYAIGWDNRINGEFASGAESWVNISFLRTRESLIGIQHKERVAGQSEGKNIKDVSRPTDQLFSIGLFFQDYLPKNKNCKMHMNTVVATGLPYGFKGDNEVYRNEYRFKPYHRVDIGFSYLLWDRHMKGNKSRHPLRFTRSTWLSAEVFNLLKIRNEASVSWIKSVYNYQFAIPNYLSSRRINIKLRMDF
ncbi:MAG TPA: carboxypeptidase-like regulatory domain-containing protein [Saprospiraceae bacterium]|nr:carboxypeptidase-like regulatory domain-containing protein [Saprospiraceae bacterium]